jgi:hypothetical protein
VILDDRRILKDKMEIFEKTLKKNAIVREGKRTIVPPRLSIDETLDVSAGKFFL